MLIRLELPNKPVEYSVIGAQTGRKLTQVEMKLAQVKIGGIPRVQTLDNQVRTVTLYHSGKEPFSGLIRVKLTDGAFV